MPPPVPTIHPPASLPTRHLLPLTPTSFAPFGTAIQNPQVGGTPANQGTATKHSSISPLVSLYPPSSAPAETKVNLFSCEPRQIPPSGIFNVRVLERHPYTTQTFIPLGLGGGRAKGCYVVIVAPTREADGLPDLGALCAFRCRGDQAVTYAAGCWHAPMVVVTDNPVDFVVLQSENGSEMDCEEVLVGEGVKVKVRGEGGNWGLWERRERL